MATARKSSAESRAEAANQDLARQIEVLREEIARLGAEFSRSRERSASAAKQAAADGVESLRAQGEIALDQIRERAGEIETELTQYVRTKPFTSLAIAAGVGFLLALLARR